MTIKDMSSSAVQDKNDYIKTFCRRMLKTQIFVGTFQEKRYVEPLSSYRDVVKVDSDEKEFIENIVAVKKKLKKQYEISRWIGITGPDTVGAPVGYNLWVILPVEVFGTYWFKVKTVEFIENEVRLKLDVIRPLRNEKSTSDVLEADESQNFDLKATVHDLSNSFKSNLCNFMQAYVTLANIKNTVIFIGLLIGTLAVGAVHVAKYLMEYILKFMKETSAFIKVCTPIIIACIEFLRKTVYGLFALIFALVHGKPTPVPPMYSYNDPKYNMLQYGGAYSEYNRPRRALPYRSKSSVVIQPLDD